MGEERADARYRAGSSSSRGEARAGPPEAGDYASGDLVRRSEESFRRVLAAAADGIVMSDKCGRIVFANQALSTMLGYADDEILGMHVDELLHPDFRAEYTRDCAAYSVAPTPAPVGRALVGRHRDGRDVPIEATLSPMDTTTDGPVVVTFLTDLTARRRGERKLLDYQEKLQRMAFDAAVAEEHARRRIAVDLHDRIGQTLTAIRLKMMKAQLRSTGAARVAIEESMELLAQTMADTRTLMFDLSPPVLYDLGFGEAINWLAQDVETRYGLQVEVTESGTLPALDETTAAILFRSVRELLINVVKHSGARNARVVLDGNGDRYEISVTDAGRGCDSDAARRPGGGGFGLFSIREQMLCLRGTLDLVTADAHGTCVTLRVPFAVASATAGPDGGP